MAGSAAKFEAERYNLLLLLSSSVASCTIFSILVLVAFCKLARTFAECWTIVCAPPRFCFI